MVWQLPSVSAADLAAASAAEAAATDASKSNGGACLEAPEGGKIKTIEESSRTSSSLDLGPTPGSGIMTADSESETSDQELEEGNDGDSRDTVDKLPDSFEQPDEKRKDSASSVLEWNNEHMTGNESIVSLQRDEEQLLAAGTAAAAADGRALGLETPSPAEDFTQQVQHSPTEEKKEEG